MVSQFPWYSETCEMCESNMISVSPVLAVFPYTIPAQFTVSA